MKYYVVEPEVAGRWGDNIVLDHSVESVRVERLHYQFDGWLGDELLASHPVYICTAQVGTALEAAGLSGFRLSDVEVSRSSQFRELHPGRKLPPFRWLQVTGEAERDDFGLRSGRLVVSDRALSCLRRFTLTQARIRTVDEFEWDPAKHTEQLFAEAKAWVDKMRKQREARKK